VRLYILLAQNCWSGSIHKLVALCTDAELETDTCIETLYHGSSILSIAILLHDDNGDTTLGDAMRNNAACR
jgi:hypothetical protein